MPSINLAVSDSQLPASAAATPASTTASTTPAAHAASAATTARESTATAARPAHRLLLPGRALPAGVAAVTLPANLCAIADAVEGL